MINNINVCLACDDNYAKYAGVVIASILHNANSDSNISIYILDGGITSENKEKILSLKSIKDCNIDFVQINDSMFDDYKKIKTHSYITLATYDRLKLPTLLPNVSRVIYLDCDMAVNSDLKELFNTELGDRAFAGCHDINPKMLETNSTYVNAGMLVMDLDNMRKANLEEAFLNWTKENVDSITCGDQEIINEVCKEQIVIVDGKWNTQVIDFVKRSNFSKKPNIIHYIAKGKPWHYASVTYYKNLYIKYLQMTPWKKSAIEEFKYRYIEQVISILKFIKGRPLFWLQLKYYRAIIETYIKG